MINYNQSLAITLVNAPLQLSSDKLGELYKDFVSNYPIVSIEDPFDQDDWDAWTKLTGEVGAQIVG